MAPAATVAKAPPTPPPNQPVAPLSRWTQRREDLGRVVVILRAGLPVDRAFDDVAAVFGDGADPAKDDVPVLIERFRGTGEVQGHLAVLVDAVTDKQSGEPDIRMRLIARANDSLIQPMRSDGTTRLGHLHRLALAAQDLLELLQPDDDGE